MPSPFIELKSDAMEQTAQALLLLKSSANSIRAGAQALMPLATDKTVSVLGEIEDSAKSIAEDAAELYNAVAPEAFGKE